MDALETLEHIIESDSKEHRTILEKLDEVIEGMNVAIYELYLELVTIKKESGKL